jgi:hypothetical protein
VGPLDAQQLATVIAGCSKSDRTAFEVTSNIDRQVSVMVAQPNDDGRWTHDGEKFIDGVFEIRCINCNDQAYASTDCPRCHRANGLADAIDTASRLTVPTRCPGCRGTELLVAGFAPARVRTGEGRPPSPTPIALFGDDGFHIAAISCDGCDWVQLADGCPLCGGPGPLRPRP